MPKGRMEIPTDPSELLTYYTFEFCHVENPPDSNTLVLVTDGISKIALGFFVPDEPTDIGPSWYGVEFDFLSELPENPTRLDWVRAWAYLGDPAEMIADCYPARACRVCGCTQDNGCPGGCSWVEWDLCSGCKGKEKPA